MTRHYKLDNLDYMILRILADNADISNYDLANKLGISPSPCLRRVKILSQKGYINGYHADINMHLLGYHLTFFASINIDYKHDEERYHFEKEISQIKEVLEVYAFLSERDYLAKIIAKDQKDYESIVSNKLSEIRYIKKIRTTKIKNTVGKKYLFGQDR